MELTAINDSKTYTFIKKVKDSTTIHEYLVTWERFAVLDQYYNKAIPYTVIISKWTESETGRISNPPRYFQQGHPLTVHSNPTAQLSLKLLKPFIE